MDTQTFLNSYVTCIRKYADFAGIGKRIEFWPFFLINLLINLVLSVLLPLIGTIYSLAMLVPSLAAGARRLHDIGKSGWLQLIWLIPVLGWVAMIYLLAQPSRT